MKCWKLCGWCWWVIELVLYVCAKCLFMLQFVILLLDEYVNVLIGTQNQNRFCRHFVFECLNLQPVFVKLVSDMVWLAKLETLWLPKWDVLFLFVICEKRMIIWRLNNVSVKYCCGVRLCCKCKCQHMISMLCVNVATSRVESFSEFAILQFYSTSETSFGFVCQLNVPLITSCMKVCGPVWRCVVSVLCSVVSTRLVRRFGVVRMSSITSSRNCSLWKMEMISQRLVTLSFIIVSCWI